MKNTPKPIIARDQVRLGLGRCWQLAISGMSYRLFRSVVTTAILSLAAAFLVHMLGFGLIENEVQRVAYERTQSNRRLGQDIFRLAKPDTDRAILQALESTDVLREREYAAWASLSPEQLAQAHCTAKQLALAADYFADLATAPKAVIVGDRTTEELFDYLAVAPNFSAFVHHLQQFALRPPLTNLQTFGTLLSERRPKLLEIVSRIRAGQRRAIEQLVAAVGPTNQAMIEQPLGLLGNALLAAGFFVAPERLRQMRAFALRSRDQKAIEQLLQQSRVLGAVARYASVDPKEVNFERLASWIDSLRDARWLHSVLRDAGATTLPDPERIDYLFAEHRNERHLSQVAGTRSPIQQGVLWGLSPRSQWLIVLSFLVCMVGVANAMLMSVTERFTEIATMKCLGAIDRFVMMMFVLEALIQGAVGGLVGLLLGIVLAIVRGAVEFGRLLALASGATSTVLLAMLLSLGATMILAALSAVGPAYVAARLSPMEAMRVE
jgi:hypothetical protein